MTVSNSRGADSLKELIAAAGSNATAGTRKEAASKDADAKAAVLALTDQLGFFGIDLRVLAIGARLVQFPDGPLPPLNLVRFG